MKHVKILIFILFIVICLQMGCKDSGTDPTDNIVIPESDVSFNEHIYPLFSAKCSSRSGCHAISGPAAGLVLIDFNEVTTHYMSNTPSEPRCASVPKGRSTPVVSTRRSPFGLLLSRDPDPG